MPKQKLTHAQSAAIFFDYLNTMKRTRLRPMSKKRQAAAKEYAAKRLTFLARRPACERCNRRPSRDVHHKAGRHGTNYLDETTWAALCRCCHQEIHNHPSLARSTGWLT